MKRNVIITSRLSSLISSLPFFFFPLFAAAQLGITPQPPVADVNLQTIISRGVAWATGLLILLAVVFIIYAAYLFLTSGGNEEDIKKAKNYVIYAAVAIAVALLANGVVAVVKGLVLGT